MGFAVGFLAVGLAVGLTVGLAVGFAVGFVVGLALPPIIAGANLLWVLDLARWVRVRDPFPSRGGSFTESQI